MRWLAWVLVVGCLKATPVQRLEAARPATFAAVLSSPDEAGERAAPDPVAALFTEELARRNLPVEGDASVQVRVHSEARFSSQLNGRYRWTVTTRISLEAGAETRVEELTVPAHLIYDHEREEEALAQAAPVIARALGRLLDDWIADGS